MTEPTPEANHSTHNQNGSPGSRFPAPILEPPLPSSPPTLYSLWTRYGKLALPLVGVGAVIAGIVGYRQWQAAATRVMTDDAVVAGQTFQITSQVPGTVASLRITENQLVYKGELLIKLDPQEQEKALQEAQAALGQGSAQPGEMTPVAVSSSALSTSDRPSQLTRLIGAMTTAQTALTEAQEAIPVAQEALDKITADTSKFKADYDRYQTLYKQGAIDPEKLTQAETAYEVARTKQQTAEEKLQTAKDRAADAYDRLSQTQADLAALRQSLQLNQSSSPKPTAGPEKAKDKSAIAQVKLLDARLNLSYAKIFAPADGRIRQKKVDINQQIQPTQILVSLVGEDLWITANVQPNQASQVRSGQPAEVQLTAFPGQTFTGVVDSVAPRTDTGVPVKVHLSDDMLKTYRSNLLPGMAAQVTIDVAPR